VVVTHLAGHPVDMPNLLRIARARGIAVIEDCSHAHGASLDGRLVGTWGDIAAFSLQTSKLLSGGEGGIVLTDSDTHLERASMLGNFRRLEGTGLRPTAGLEETGLGLKLRMSPLSAALARHYLSVMDDLIAARHARLDHLTAMLAARAGDHFAPPVTRPGAFRGAFYEYHVRTQASSLAFVRAALAAEGCSLPHSNTKAIHTLSIFRRPLDRSIALVLGDGDRSRPLAPPLPMANAEALAMSTFTLPTFTFEPYELVDAYVDALVKVAAHLSDATMEAGT
jgi:dTDP-4-amino-4,6-dideoxygalactose transaminase